VSTHWKAHSRRSSSFICAPALPKYQSRLIQDEIALVGAGLHSRQTTMTSLGILDPEREMAQMQKGNAGAVRQPSLP